MDRAILLPPPSSKRIAVLLSSALDDCFPADPDQRRMRRDEVSALIWEAFTRLSDHDRQFWAHCIWHRRCLCSLAQRTGLTIAEISDRLKATAGYLDQTCEAICVAGPCNWSSPLGPGVTPIGTSGRKLSLLLRDGALHCICERMQSLRPGEPEARWT